MDTGTWQRGLSRNLGKVETHESGSVGSNPTVPAQFKLIMEVLSDVKTKKHPPEGLFKSGSAKKIANWAWSSHNGDLRKAMASLNFYINRGGENLSADQKSKIEAAKEILRSKKKD